MKAIHTHRRFKEQFLLTAPDFLSSNMKKEITFHKNHVYQDIINFGEAWKQIETKPETTYEISFRT